MLGQRKSAGIKQQSLNELYAELSREKNLYLLIVRAAKNFQLFPCTIGPPCCETVFEYENDQHHNTRVVRISPLAVLTVSPQGMGGRARPN